MAFPAFATARWPRRLAWLSASLLVLAICGALYLRDARQIDQANRDREVLRVGSLARFFTNEFQRVAADVRFLGEEDALQSYLATGRSAPLDAFARELLHLSRQHPEYDQIRYLDEQGREQVRVMQDGGIAPRSGLLDRHASPFFAGTMAAGPGEIYVSAFDLYANQGRVEQPFKPAIRLAQPVFDPQGRRRGVLVINYLGTSLLNNLKQMTAANQHRMRVLNAQGYWLHSSHPEEEWGFQVPGRADRTLARSAPDFWRHVAAEPEGQLPYQGGWFTWQHVVPGELIAHARSAEPFLVVASEFPESERIAALADRRQTFLLVTLVMLAITNGAVWFFLARQRERQRAEHALRLASAAAQESTRLKARFLANMSHEIRTPMNGVIGVSDLLLGTPLNEEQRSLVGIVRTSAEALLTIINDILDFSKIEAGQLTMESIAFDLADPVDNCLGLLAETARAKGIDLAARIADDVPRRLVGDPGRLHQVLLNLVGNALKFTERGRVDLGVAAVAVGGRRTRLRFTVQDTGVGIAPEAQGRLFQPFVQADSGTTRKYGGTGLGLAICRQLVSLLGGEIGLESAPGRGTTFWFTAEFALPETPEAAAREAAPPPPASLALPLDGAEAGRRILVVEDNPVNQHVARLQLQQLGYEPDIVASGREAIAALEGPHPYRVVLMDCQMPDLDGIETTRRIRAREREREAAPGGVIPVFIIAMTANAMVGDRDTCLAAGMNDYISKPVRAADLAGALARARVPMAAR
jgi:signal transduction histidine kinase/ActR/RegA family two-component response regulator